MSVRSIYQLSTKPTSNELGQQKPITIRENHNHVQRQTRLSKDSPNVPGKCICVIFGMVKINSYVYQNGAEQLR